MADILEASAIDRHLKRPHQLQVLPTVDSTNRLAKTQLLAGQTPDIILADHQTAGYGRQSRTFVSPGESGIYLSLVRPPVPLAQLPLVTPMLAVAAVQAITAVAGLKPQIKWVNDLYLNHHKVAGILAENLDQGLILGIGINFKANSALAAVEKAGFLLPEATLVTRNQLIAAIINQVDLLWPQLVTGAFMDFYRQYSLLIGQTVTLQLGQRTVVGQVNAIGAQGELILKDAHGLTAYTSGEVVHVLAWT